MTPAIDPALLRETLGHYPTGVAVVTAIAEDGNPAGMVVGTFSSVSLDPPLIAFFPPRTRAASRSSGRLDRSASTSWRLTRSHCAAGSPPAERANSTT